MKKFLIIFILILVVNTGLKSFAVDEIQNNNNKPTLISFIYINGSNDLSYKNRLKFKDAFERDVKELHPIMIEGFEKDALAQNLFLKNGKYKINPEPVMFYWGDRSLNEVKNIDKGLENAKNYTPRIAGKVRSIFAHCLHDAVWVQKYQNMSPVIDDLQKIVKEQTDKGHKVVLFGYSAGSFITYNYFLHKFTSIVPNELVANAQNEEIMEIINSTPVQPTCLDALLETELIKLDVSGKFQRNSDIENFKKKYPELDKQTNLTCFKNDNIKGVVNFASPLVLFYSDATDATTSINFLSQLMIKNIVENDIFFLIVNYRNDPFGFPSAENITMKKLQSSNNVLAKYFKAGNGFIFNKSDIYVPRTFITAHLAYWSTPKRFVKGIIKAYNEGYTNFYSSSLAEKVIK